MRDAPAASNRIEQTLTRRLREAFEFKNANSTAAESISERFVQSGRRASRAVRSCEGP